MGFFSIWLFLLVSSLTMYVRRADAQDLRQEVQDLASEAVGIVTSVAPQVASMYNAATSILTDSANSEVRALSSQASSIFNSVSPEAVSMYTELTSILADSSNTSPASTSATATSSSRSSSLTTSPSTSKPSSSSASTQVAASSSTNTPSGKKDGNSNTVAIVVGSVLGAIVLALLVLLCLLCLRRRRRQRRDRRGVSPSNAEVEGWRLNNGSHPHVAGPTHLAGPAAGNRSAAGHDHAMAAAVAPAMTERSMHGRHHNPFVPVPPPPRRTAPNSRPGLTDGPDPGHDAYSAARHPSGVHPAHRGMAPYDAPQSHGHGFAKEIGAGVGGAALGAAAMKHHDGHKGHRKESFELPANSIANPNRRSIPRKPVSAINTAAANDTPPEETTLLSNRSSVDGYGNGHGYKSGIVSPVSPIQQDPVELPTSSFDRPMRHERRPSNEPLLGEAGAAAAGGVAGAALANRHGHDRDRHERPGVHRDDSYKIENPHDNQQTNSPYHSQQSNSPYLPYRPNYNESPSGINPPAAALGAVHRHRRSETPPDVPRRSPARMSFSKDTPPSGDSSESVNATDAPNFSRRTSNPVLQAIQGGDRAGGDRTSDTIPVMWRKSVEGPRMPPKGVTYHDYQPIQRGSPATTWRSSADSGFVSTPVSGHNSASSSGSGPSGGTGYGQGQASSSGTKVNQSGRRVSLNDLIEDERRKMDGQRSKSRARYHSGGQMPGSYDYDGSGYGDGVGQAY